MVEIIFLTIWGGLSLSWNSRIQQNVLSLLLHYKISLFHVLFSAFFIKFLFCPTFNCCISKILTVCLGRPQFHLNCSFLYLNLSSRILTTHPPVVAPGIQKYKLLNWAKLNQHFLYFYLHYNSSKGAYLVYGASLCLFKSHNINKYLFLFLSRDLS